MAFSSRPSKCAKCSNTHKFHKHSTFVRKKLYGANGWVRNFTMQRFRCIACTHVFTLFQSFVAPYQQSTISIFKRIARCTNLSKSSLLKIFSYRTLLRWRKRLKSLAKTYFNDITKKILAFKPMAIIDFKDSSRISPFDYLAELFKQFFETKAMRLLVFLLLFSKHPKKSIYRMEYPPHNKSSIYFATPVIAFKNRPE